MHRGPVKESTRLRCSSLEPGPDPAGTAGGVNPSYPTCRSIARLECECGVSAARIRGIAFKTLFTTALALDEQAGVSDVRIRGSSIPLPMIVDERN
jgi:hypothetical protein